MKVKEPRKVRGYKATDKDYNKAMKWAKKNNIPLASFMEVIIKGVGEGLELKFIKPLPTGATAIDATRYALDHFSNKVN
jgi:hypothetical protein